MRALAGVVFAVLLTSAGCGFQLRGTANLPFESLYIPSPGSGIALELKRNIQAGTGTRVVDSATQARAVLEFTSETREKDILSLTGGGRVREFRLRYRVGFRVYDPSGTALVPDSSIELTREMTFNDAAILPKEAEEQLLYRDMQADMAQQIVRRLSAANSAVR
ncbi:MAG: LPS assembly lipoprotein LptE [Betaproteobacteria bacterium]|nr:LPS assembly lipoprotein LptE [Betaproteobacteria bacterium]